MNKEDSKMSSLRSSSSRRESLPGNHHAKAAATVNVGCMSGIFKLISNKYHTRRKFLTFRKRHQETQAPASSQTQKQQKLEHNKCKSRDQHTPCSQQVIRNSPPSPPPPVVARLMGLADIPPSPVISKAEERRRKLVGALERCDEDLRALKNKIIEAARATQTPPRTVVDMVAAGGDEPSPVSVLDHHYHHDNKMTMLVHRSPCFITNGQELRQQEIIKKRQSRQYIRTKKKPGEDDHNATIYLPNYPRPSSLMTTTTHGSFIFVPSKRRTFVLDSATTHCSAAMKETVSEVCRDLAQGQRRQVGTLALILQDIIYGDLVDEIIKDFGACYSYDLCFTSPIRLPFEACKRQLCF